MENFTPIVICKAIFCNVFNKLQRWHEKCLWRSVASGPDPTRDLRAAEFKRTAREEVDDTGGGQRQGATVRTVEDRCSPPGQSFSAR